MFTSAAVKRVFRISVGRQRMCQIYKFLFLDFTVTYSEVLELSPESLAASMIRHTDVYQLDKTTSMINIHRPTTDYNSHYRMPLTNLIKLTLACCPWLDSCGAT